MDQELHPVEDVLYVLPPHVEQEFTFELDEYCELPQFEHPRFWVEEGDVETYFPLLQVDQELHPDEDDLYVLPPHVEHPTLLVDDPALD